MRTAEACGRGLPFGKRLRSLSLQCHLGVIVQAKVLALRVKPPVMTGGSFILSFIHSTNEPRL